MASNGNGSTPTIPASGTQVEIGSVIDRDRIFTDFNDGRIFTPLDVTPRKLDQMLRLDGKGRSIEQALTLPLRAADWDITPAKGDSGEAEWLNDALTRSPNAGGMSTPIELVISQAVSACLFRRAFFEKVFRYDDQGKVVYDKVSYRPPATCRLLVNPASGAFEGFQQRVPTDHPKQQDGYVEIPAQRSFVFIYGQHRRPIEGVSDLESCYALFELKQKIKFLWATFLENLTMPKAIAQDEAGKEEANKLARKVAGLKGGGVVGIGPGQSVTAFETSNAAAQAFADAIRFIDSEMYASVLAGFLELASAASLGRGSYALSESQTDFFLQSRQAVLTELAASIEGFLFADLIRINFGPGAAVPQFKFHSLKAGDVQNSVTLLQALAAAPQLSPGLSAFRDELAQKVAGYLDLPIDKVRQAFEQAATQAPPNDIAQLQSSVGLATRLVQQVQAQQAGNQPQAPANLSDAVDLSAELKDLRRSMRSEPKVDVHAPISVTTPDVQVAPPDVHVDVHPPNVEVHSPDIHVTVERGGGFTIERDSQGNVTGTQPKEN